ncbi:MAG: DUF1599 domain-containing protein [Bernardetiaceae bacterium]|jgi:hypothetical protein|nr:DUF1599 domain-containing protein [Bernardetiaceae bacterium]
MPDTLAQYQRVIAHCRHLFEDKTRDYGTAWRILRLPSLTDQLYIKAMRIRSVQEKGTQKIADDLAGEFVAIVNYAVMALVQMRLPPTAPLELGLAPTMAAYDQVVADTLALQQNKNHDYGEAWRLMRVSSITDIILMKLLRVKQIEDNAGATLVSEGVEGSYRDMINYAVFALILLGQAND